MSHSEERSLKFLGVLLLAATTGLGCSVKGIQNQAPDGGTDAGRRDGGKSDVRDAGAGRSVAGNSGGAGASGGVGGYSIYSSYVAGVIATSSLAGNSSSSGGASSSSSSKKLDAGIFDTNRPDTRDAAGGTVKLDAWVPDANRADARDAVLGGSGGSSSSTGGSGGTGSRDAWIPPDAPLPDAYIPPDAPVGGTGGGGSSGSAGSGGASSLPVPKIDSFNVTDGTNQGTEITVSAGKSVTFMWVVSGAVTKSIEGVGDVTGSTKSITLPTDLTEETPITYKLIITNSTSDASATYDKAEATVKVNVVPLSATLTADPPTIDQGGSAKLLPVFAGTTASIDEAVGTVTSGAEYPVSPTTPTKYTLTVGNRLGDSVKAEVTVNVTGLDASPGE